MDGYIFLLVHRKRYIIFKEIPGISVCKLMGKDIYFLDLKLHFATVSHRVAYSDILGDLGLIPSDVSNKNIVA